MLDEILDSFESFQNLEKKIERRKKSCYMMLDEMLDSFESFQNSKKK